MPGGRRDILAPLLRQATQIPRHRDISVKTSRLPHAQVVSLTPYHTSETVADLYAVQYYARACSRFLVIWARYSSTSISVPELAPKQLLRHCSGGLGFDRLLPLRAGRGQGKVAETRAYIDDALLPRAKAHA